MKHFGKAELIIALIIVLITGGIIAYKVYALDYSMTMIQPESGYFIRLIMTVTGNGDDCDVRVALPIQSDRQAIKYERESSEGAFKYTISPGRIGRWHGDKLSGEHTITYSFFAQAQPDKYPLPEGDPIPTAYPDALSEYLKPAKNIESDAPEIVAKAQELVPPGTDIRTAVQNIYNYCYASVRYVTVSGPTSALVALKLEEASCNGKNRLMVALLRARGIPARMANGLILENARKRTTHAWTEVRYGKTWVPYCPTNGYVAEIPGTYLELAKGDVAVFTHTPHIGFDWRFVVQHQLSEQDEVVFSNANNPLNILHTWVSLKDYHISLTLIMIILMIPVGANVVAFSRNIIGLLPFGTFMPALIAVSFRDTGLWLGGLFLVVIVVVGCVLNLGLMRLRLLHVPRLVVIITFVVMAILVLSIVCLQAGISNGAAVSLFPMAILSLTCERFTLTLVEDGWKDASRRMVSTFAVASACYLVYNIQFLQVALVAFPELLFCNIAIALVMGSWTGMRLTEYYRFRALVREHQASDTAHERTD